MERVRGPERLVHHILVSATVTEADLTRTRQRAGEIRDSVLAGTSIRDFDSRSDDIGIPNSLDAIPLDQLNSLPPPYGVPLQNSQAGDIVGPLEFAWQGQTAIVVAEVTDVREAGEFTFEEMSAQVRQILSEQKFQERLVERLRSDTHVETRW